MDDMKKFNSSVGATTDCTLRTLLDTIPPQVSQEKHGIRGDAWFSSVKMANKVGLRGAVFPSEAEPCLVPHKEFIEKALKRCAWWHSPYPRGSFKG
jgi:hypothetical protein